MSPVSIHGREYATVAERLKVAHGEADPPTGIQSIETRTIGVGNLVVVHATVTFQDGRHFDGTSMVNMNATGPAERDAPLETCETSAVGRALAMAGYPGSDAGLAGAEELALAQARSQARTTRYADDSTAVTRMPGAGTAAPRPVQGQAQVTNYAASPAQVRYLRQLWDQAGRPMPPPDAEQMDRKAVSALIDELRGELNIPPKP
jgi:hypothetical protein